MQSYILQQRDTSPPNQQPPANQQQQQQIRIQSLEPISNTQSFVPPQPNTARSPNQPNTIISEQNIQTLNQAYMSSGNFVASASRKMRGPRDSKPSSINKVPQQLNLAFNSNQGMSLREQLYSVKNSMNQKFQFSQVNLQQ
jgi:hypothetical protein